MFDAVMVDYYGTMTPLNQVAKLSVPDPTMVVAQPFDPSTLPAIEKAILAADLGLNPGERREARADPDPLADRGAPEAARQEGERARRRGQDRGAPAPPRGERRS